MNSAEKEAMRKQYQNLEKMLQLQNEKSQKALAEGKADVAELRKQRDELNARVEKMEREGPRIEYRNDPVESSGGGGSCSIL